MSMQVKPIPMTPTREHPYIFKLEKFKSIALEFLNNTIFLPGNQHLFFNLKSALKL